MLTRWSHFTPTEFAFGDLGHTLEVMDQVRREMDRIVRGHRHGSPAADAGWPRMSLYDAGEALVVRAELPGFDSDDLDLQVERGTLTLRGRRDEAAPEGFTAHRRERGAMEFARAFTLPAAVDPDRAEADLRDGVLELTLPKAPEAQPRRIDVRTA